MTVILQDLIEVDTASIVASSSSDIRDDLGD